MAPSPPRRAAARLPAMLRLLPLLLLPLAFPTGAQAACGVAPAKAVYETPSVQVYAKPPADRRLLPRRPASRSDRRERPTAESGPTSPTVLEVARRAVHPHAVLRVGRRVGGHADGRHIFDLRTDGAATAPVLSEENDNQVVALPGAIVTAGEDGVIARYTEALLRGDQRGAGRHGGGRGLTAVLARRGRRAHAGADAARAGPGPRVATRPHDRPLQAAPRRPLIVRDASIVSTRAGRRHLGLPDAGRPAGRPRPARLRSSRHGSSPTRARASPGSSTSPTASGASCRAAARQRVGAGLGGARGSAHVDLRRARRQAARRRAGARGRDRRDRHRARRVLARRGRQPAECRDLDFSSVE